MLAFPPKKTENRLIILNLFHNHFNGQADFGSSVRVYHQNSVNTLLWCHQFHASINFFHQLFHINPFLNELSFSTYPTFKKWYNVTESLSAEEKYAVNEHLLKFLTLNTFSQTLPHCFELLNKVLSFLNPTWK